MGQRNLAGLRRIAPAYQRYRARRMMRRAKRSLAPLRGRESQHAGGKNGGWRQRFVIGHGRKKTWQPGSEHGLARARRPDHQQVMTARRRDFKRPARAGMADYIDQIGQRCALAQQGVGRRTANGRQAAVDRAAQVCTQSGQIGGPEYIDTRHQRRFRRATQGQVDFGHARIGVAHGCAIQR